MGIDNVAIKTFNSSGAQSVCRANEADETKLIESQFLTKCTTEYINGSGMTYIPGTTGLDLTGSTARFETFHLPSDCDAISDIVYSAREVSGTAFLVTDINKIEVKVGNLVVQTIKPSDITSRNITELAYTNPGTDPVFSIPFIGRSKNVRNSFLQAGAITNAMSLKITYVAARTPTKLNTSLCVTTHQITKTEKDFLAKNIINRVLNVSQNVETKVPGTSSDTVPEVTIDLSSVNINVSHILISGARGGTDETVELVLGNDRTGNIPIALLQSKYNTELFSLAGGGGVSVYLIKTADSAFSTAGIPFSRLNNKKLILKGSFTGAAVMSVTACGTQIQTTVGGSISFSS
jgi:hypothetical protein